MPHQRGSLEIPAACRWKPCEVFFGDPGAVSVGGDPNDSASGEPGLHMSIQEAFAESLLSLAIDIRALAVQNIAIVGGSAMLPGFLLRLASEMVAELKSRENLRPLADRLLFTSL